MEMLLPGGMADSQGVHKDFAFRLLTGAVELAMADSVRSNMVHPQMVTGVLSSAIAHIGSRVVSPEQVSNLCVGDRQFLMRQLVAFLGRDARWLTAECSQCGVGFDFFIELSKLPVKPAGRGYPLVRVDTAAGSCEFRLPAGSDQSEIVSIANEKQASAVLLNRCLITVNGEKPPEEGIAFCAKDMALIDAAMEAVAPEIAMQVQASCPGCGADNVMELDLSDFVSSQIGNIYTDIHTLAWYYHWGEEEILNMPRSRRQQYLALIDRARGLHRQPEGLVQ